MAKNGSVTLATPQEIEKWDSLLLKNPDGGEILQTTAMAEVKKLQGWAPESWVYDTSFGKVYASVLTKRLRGYGKLAYIIRGPGVQSSQQLAEIVEINNTRKEFFAIKLEPPIPHNEADEINSIKGLTRVRTIQPNAHTIVVDLSRDESAILAGFRQRARREIRQAEKDGITVKQVRVISKTMRQMYELYLQTGKRAGFFVRPFNYYYRFWKTFAQHNNGELYFAYQKGNNQPVAGAYICKFGKKALYKDGGSRRTSSKHFSHLLQWEIMKNLKSEGVENYDLHGISPPEEQGNPEHSMAGLNIFKQSFSQTSESYIGTYDQIINARTYHRWLKHGQKLYSAVSHRLKKTTFY